MTDSYDSRSLGRRLNELLLLAALRRAPMHGYQIALDLEERSGGFFTFHHGTLYPILHHLESEGLIAGDWSDPETGRARKEYALTEAGRARLRETLAYWRDVQERLGRVLDDDAFDEPVRTSAA